MDKEGGILDQDVINKIWQIVNFNNITQFKCIGNAMTACARITIALIIDAIIPQNIFVVLMTASFSQAKHRRKP